MLIKILLLEDDPLLGESLQDFLEEDPSQTQSDGAIRVYINRLKHEIGNDRIVNVRGMGYRLTS